MLPGVMYLPSSKSSSADYYLRSNRCIIGIQIKHELQGVSRLVIEFLKAKPTAHIEEKFLFLSMNKAFTQIPVLIGSNCFALTNHKGQTIGYRFTEGHSFEVKTKEKKLVGIMQDIGLSQGVWSVPKNCEIVLLTGDGMMDFFTPRIWELMTHTDKVKKLLQEKRTRDATETEEDRAKRFKRGMGNVFF